MMSMAKPMGKAGGQPQGNLASMAPGKGMKSPGVSPMMSIRSPGVGMKPTNMGLTVTPGASPMLSMAPPGARPGPMMSTMKPGVIEWPTKSTTVYFII